MTRINTNVPSLIAQNRLQSSNNDLNTALTRLSTGLRINSGADDPAGLIASEALRSEITSLGSAITNTNRASQIISTADSALGEVSNLLNDIRGLVVEAANSGALSDDEIAANQLQIDSSLEAINRIAQTTTFQGRNLLDGSLDFQSTASNVESLADINIDQANLGALGSINVDVDVQAAATRASITSTGIPASAPGANSSATLSFAAATPDGEAAGSVSLGNSTIVGAEASGAITFANATTPNGEVAGTLTLDSGVAIDIEAVDGGAADGTFGNDTTFEVNVLAPGATSTASFDAANNVFTLNLAEGDNAAEILADIGTSDPDFDITGAGSGAAITVAAGDAGPYTTPTGPGAPGFNITTAGTDSTDPTTGFTLTAVDGGPADGAVGNATDVVFTSGSTTSASFDVDANVLNVTVADGASVNDVFNAINSGAGTAVQASNLNNGSFAFSTTDLGTVTDPLSAGATATVAAGFDIEAVNGQAADGTTGNSTTLNFTSGATTEATFDADANVLNITVADGASVDDIAAAINTDGTFLTRNVLSGDALFNAADLGTNTPTISTPGTDGSANDVITITADDPSASFDGRTVTVNADNSLAAGAATASLDTDGNIVVNISNNGDVTLGTIEAAINELDGFSALATTTDGDQTISTADIGAATTTDFAGGAAPGGLGADLVVQLRGSAGSEVFQFEQGATLDSIVQSINLVSDATGIQATNDNGTLSLASTSYGSSGLIDVEIISEGAGGTFGSGLSANRAIGSDIQASINGVTANGNGNSFSINTSTLDLSLTVDDGSSTDFSFQISGGGAQFQLGPNVTSTQQARLGIGSVSTGQLGGPSGRLFELGSGQARSLTNDVTGAGQIIDEVIGQVTGLRGRLGAFQATTLNSNLVSLQETQANLLEAESSIRDADFAQESANLTRAQILVQSGTNVLSLANQNPQNVLSLLG